MKLLRIGPVYFLALFCLLASGVCQVRWMQQLFRAEYARLRAELENQVGLVAEQAIYASSSTQPLPLSPYRAFFLSPAWRQLHTAFDNLNNLNFSTIHLSKQSTSLTSTDSLNFTFSLTLRVKKLERSAKAHNSYLASLTPRQLAQLDRQSFGYLQHAIDSLLRSHHLGSATGYRIYGADGVGLLAVAGARPGRVGYVSRPYAYNGLHLRTYQLVLSSLVGAIFYRLRYSLASAGLLLLLTGITFGVLLQLVRSQRRYAEAQVAFTSHITHELKTPVATVGLALESITKFELSQDPAKLRDYVAMGQQELRRLTQLIENVLALGQAESGLAALRLELYDVQEGLQQAVATFRPQFAKQGGRLTFQPSPEPCLVLGDPVHLTNVCYNLLENALKHGGAGVQVQLTCVRTGKQVRLRFQDNGPGIAPAYQARVFERFFRVPGPASSHTAKGTGLGLAYVKQIVTQHRGAISLRSALGKGSQFTITLPAA